MPGWAEVLRALEGSVALIRRDPQASRFFDLSADSFWRSFGAIIYILPVYVVLVLSQRRLLLDATESPEAVSGMGLLVLEAVILGLDWIAYPLAMYFLVRMFDLGGRYASYIIVYNWSTLLVVLAMTPPFMLFVMGLLPLDAVVFLNFVTILAVLWYRWVIASDVLGAPGITAAGFVALDFAMSMVIEAMFASLFI